MIKVLYVGIGGFIGASLRYMISTNAARFLGTAMPYGTLIENVVGGFLMGFLMELSFNTELISSDMRLFLTTGILGGLTTFSTFSYETMALINEGSYMLGALNISLNLFLSLIGVVLGRYLVIFFV